MSLKCTLPEEKDIFGDERSNIYDFISPVPRATDRLMATGARRRLGGTVTSWLKDAYISFLGGEDPEAKVIWGNGEVFREIIHRKGLAAQPILKFSSMDDLKGVVHGELEDWWRKEKAQTNGRRTKNICWIKNIGEECE